MTEMRNQSIHHTAPHEGPLDNAGNYSIIPRSTDDDRLIALWLNQHQSPHTRRQYEHQATLFRQWFHPGQNRPLQTITFADLDDWANQLSGKDNTRKTKINVIKSLFSFAHRVGYLRVNPAVMLKPPKTADRKHAKVLSESEIHSMLAHAKRPRTKAIIRTLYSAGLRISELTALTWADVLPAPTGKATLIIWGKGGKQREAGISAETYQTLLALRPSTSSGQVPELVEGPVIQGRGGKPMDRTVILRLLRKTAVAAGITRPISPHWFRHSHATHALARGANVADVQAQLGHASLATTTTYAHGNRSSSDYLAV